jgi:hypothetical protein
LSGSAERLAGRDRRYIKGQKYTLLSRKENLTLDGKRALKTLILANKRFNTAYVFKESFGQLWSYEREGWARRFFDNWRDGLNFATVFSLTWATVGGVGTCSQRSRTSRRRRRR